MPLNMTMTREALLERLNDRLGAARKEDDRIRDAHQKDESAALAAFRKRCKAAMTWGYEELKKNNFRIDIEYSHRPSCPSSEAMPIKQALDSVKLDTRKSPFNFNSESDLGRAACWVPKSEKAKDLICAD